MSENELPKAEIRFCPKCNNPMKQVNPYHIIPRLGPYQAVESGTAPAVSLDTGYIVEIWACKTCRYVEMYAGGRKGAEE